MKKKPFSLLQLVLSIVIAHAAGLIGSLFTITGTGSWFVQLAKPTWNPPNEVFGPVWFTLYTFMGIAAYLVYREKKAKGRKQALQAYALQLLLNSLWSIVFFGMQMPGLAFVNIVFVLLAILLTMQKFWSISKWATYLFIPYLAWVSFATVLNYTIWMLNR